jgi:hypothetical protein
MASGENYCTGCFWEGRCKSQAALDVPVLLACMAYVDLNPIRAAMARAPEQSDYTSIQERIEHPDNDCLLPFSEQGNNTLPFNLKDYLEWIGVALRSNGTSEDIFLLPHHRYWSG